MNINEKAAYIKGLFNGMEYDAESKEGRLFTAVIDLLEDLASDVSDLEDRQAAAEDYIEEIDEDLGALEEDVYDVDGCNCGDDEDYDCEDEDCDCCDEGEWLDCPACGEPVYINPDELPEDRLITCPNCKKEILVKEIGEDEEE